MMDSGVVVRKGLSFATIGLFGRTLVSPTHPDFPALRRRTMVNIQDLFDDAKCFDTIRDMRWPDGVTCPKCSSDSVIKNGRDDTQPLRQRYECRGCRQRFDDLTDTIFAGHHLPLRTWIACLYLMGLNLSGLQIAQELDINKDDARSMIQQLRQGIVDRSPPVVLEGEVECDEVYVVAGHKGHPEAVKKKAVSPGGDA
jgi:transposase-like protein